MAVQDSLGEPGRASLAPRACEAGPAAGCVLSAGTLGCPGRAWCQVAKNGIQQGGVLPGRCTDREAGPGLGMCGGTEAGYDWVTLGKGQGRGRERERERRPGPGSGAHGGQETGLTCRSGLEGWGWQDTCGGPWVGG